ncbi:MAG: glycosyltransferase family 4 protein [Planctomycetota bacterium]
MIGSKKSKILIVNQRQHLKGGAAKYALYVSQTLRENGFETVFFAGKHPDNTEEHAERYYPDVAFPETFGDHPIHRRAILAARFPYNHYAAECLRKMIKAEKPALVHYHNVFRQLSPAVLRVATQEGIPSVWSLHDYNIFCVQGFMYRKGSGVCEKCKGHKYYNAIRHLCYRNNFMESTLFATSVGIGHFLGCADGIGQFTVPHKDMKNRLVAWGLDAARITVIKNPYPLSPAPTDLRKEDYCIYFSAYHESKGIDCLLEAARIANDVKILLCGFGDGRERVKKRIQHYDIGDNVKIVDGVTWNDGLQKLVAKALCVVNPSIAWNISEYVNLDAYAMKTALIASNIGGNSYVVDDGVTGRLFEPGNSQQLASHLKWICANRNTAVEMGRNGRAYLEKNYTVQGFVKELLELFRRGGLK